MAGPSRHWWRLIAGVIALQILLLLLDRIPGLAAPELVENRALAQLPARPRSPADLERFRVGLDAYVTDQFPARRRLIAGLNYLRYLAGYSGTARVVVGRQGWLFYDNDSHLSQLRPSSLAAAEITAWVDTLEARGQWLARRNIVHVVVAPPVKERLYPEHAPAWAGDGKALADADLLAAAATQAKVTSYVDLRRSLAAARADGLLIYSPFDTHWSGEGAYVAYAALLQALAARGLPVAPRPRHYFAELGVVRAARPQDLAHMLGIAGFVEQTFVQLHDPSLTTRIRYLTAATDWAADRVIETGREGPVLLLTGDSFSNVWLPLISGHFSRVVFSHHQNGFFRQDLIERFKPDVVLLEVIEPGLRHAMQPAMTKAAGASHALPAPDWRQITPLPELETGAARAGVTYHCNLERLAVGGLPGKPVLDAEGWFLDVARGGTSETIEMIVQDNASAWALWVPITRLRADVAHYFNQPMLARSGFRLESELTRIPPGEYRVYLRMQSAQRNLVCVTRRGVLRPAVMATRDEGGPGN